MKLDEQLRSIADEAAAAEKWMAPLREFADRMQKIINPHKHRDDPFVRFREKPRFPSTTHGELLRKPGLGDPIVLSYEHGHGNSIGPISEFYITVGDARSAQKAIAGLAKAIAKKLPGQHENIAAIANEAIRHYPASPSRLESAWAGTYAGITAVARYFTGTKTSSPVGPAP